MKVTAPDGELVSAYAVQRSETAFGALVQRHVDLVFATALRHSGNAAMAEDITQQVFISLARKAPRLAGVQTLAGWLHRATVLETKMRIRSELRRRQREQTAGEMIHFQNEGASPFAALLPLLDEALLNLRETDRLALVLRFLEERSLRDVGAALGVDEDAARKRVARALARLGAFFQRRGFAISAGAGGAALLSSAVQAAPAALAGSVANAAITPGAAAGALNLFLVRLMTLSKTQTAVLCALAVAIPLLVQNHAQALAAREQAALAPQITSATRHASELDAQLQEIRQEGSRAEIDAFNGKLQLNSLRSEATNRALRAVYRWDNNSPYLRVPKKAFQNMRLETAANRHGQLTSQIKQALLMTGAETDETEAAMSRFLSAYGSTEATQMKAVDPSADELQGHTLEQTKAFEVPYIGSNAMTQLRQDLFGQVTSILGDDRARIFTNALQWWMPITENYSGISSGMVAFNFPYHAVFYQPEPGKTSMRYRVIGKQSAMSAELSASDVPDLFAPYLQDWIAQMQTQPGDSQ